MAAGSGTDGTEVGVVEEATAGTGESRARAQRVFMKRFMLARARGLLGIKLLVASWPAGFLGVVIAMNDLSGVTALTYSGLWSRPGFDAGIVLLVLAVILNILGWILLLVSYLYLLDAAVAQAKVVEAIAANRPPSPT